MSSVAVILPVRGPAPYLEETLASIQAQTFEDYEIHCVLDGPDDELERRLRKEPKVILHVHPTNYGVARARNTALAAIQCKYVATIDADDVWSPSHLEKTVRFLESEPSVAMCGTSAVVIDEFDQILPGRRVGKKGSRRRALVFRNQFIQSSVLIRTDQVRTAGAWNPETRISADYDLFMRVATIGDVRNLPDEFIKYRIHEAQMSQTSFDGRELAAIARSRAELASSVGIPTVVAELTQFVWEKWIRSASR